MTRTYYWSGFFKAMRLKMTLSRITQIFASKVTIGGNK